MADANLPSRPVPGDWPTAFAALPLERPRDDTWARLSAALPTLVVADAAGRPRLRRGARWKTGFAAAASIVLALPLAWWLGTPMQAPTPGPMAVAPQTVDSGAARTSTHVGRPAAAARVDHVDRVTGSAVAGVEPASRPASPDARTRPGGGAVAGASRPAAAPSIASAASMAEDAAITPAVVDAAPADEAALAALRAQSARLETLVAYARDDRMTSAPAAVLAASVDDRIRLIDAALMQPGVDIPTRTSLWHERVDALQELASLEGTQRWMAAHGASMDAVARVD